MVAPATPPTTAAVRNPARSATTTAPRPPWSSKNRAIRLLAIALCKSAKKVVLAASRRALLANTCSASWKAVPRTSLTALSAPPAIGQLQSRAVVSTAKVPIAISRSWLAAVAPLTSPVPPARSQRWALPQARCSLILPHISTTKPLIWSAW